MTKEQKKKICAKYSAHDENGLVHCNECPLVVGNKRDCLCKMNSYYDRKRKEWIPMGCKEVIIKVTNE